MGQASVSFHALFNFILAGGNAGILLLFMLAQAAAALFFPRSWLARPPFFWPVFKRASSWIDRKLNRDRRSQKERFFRGLAAVLTVAAAAGLAGVLVDSLRLHSLAWLISLLFLTGTMQAALPFFFTSQFFRLVKKNDRAGIAALLSSVGRGVADTKDMHAVSRRAIEAAAWLLNRFFVGPLFWFLLAGAAGCAVFIAVTALDRVMGVNDDEHRFFGWTAARLDDALNFIPARLTVVLIVIAAVFLPQGHPVRAFQLVWGAGRRWPGLNFGVVMAAVAGSLGVTLGGPGLASRGNDSSDAILWMGDSESSARLKISDIRRAKWLFGICFFITLLLVFLFFLSSMNYLHIFI